MEVALTPELRTPSGRLLSLDAFRGATIAAMVLVNDPGTWSDVYPQLRHSAWHGWTFTDWVFPFFLFIVGVAMTFSLGKRLTEATHKSTLVAHVIRRSLIIFVFGLFVNGFPFWLDPNFSLAGLRIPGVLQRIAVCYAAASFILLSSGIRGQITWIVVLLSGYWLLVKLIPVPGYGAGVLEPKGNLLWYIDSRLLAGHTWTLAPAPGFDPEGILSTVPAIGTTLLGVLTGHLLRSGRSKEEKAGWMFVAGLTLLLIGTVLDMWLPINKNMWTSSYVLFMGGCALECLGVFYWLIDVRGYSKWSSPFVILGMNAILIYVLSETLAAALEAIRWEGPGGSLISLHEFIYSALFLPVASGMNASLGFAIAFVLGMYAVAWLLWRKRWFLTA
jgi:predicted acyltransferase